MRSVGTKRKCCCLCCSILVITVKADVDVLWLVLSAIAVGCIASHARSFARQVSWATLVGAGRTILPLIAAALSP